MSISVITLVHQRERHLQNLIKGLIQSTYVPQEFLIVYMNEKKNHALPKTVFPVRSLHVTSSETQIPLARARNLGAREAQSDLLVFLDVDCIPDPGLLRCYLSVSQQVPGLLMGDIRYLPTQSVSDEWTMDKLYQKGVAHPGRPVLTKAWEYCSRYELFWSLNFAITKNHFRQIGGFDEGYQGYGAEDTDFALSAQQEKIAFALCQAVCFHQHHAVYRPPLQHFTDIVMNAQRFHDKWQRWPMESWLQSFADLQLIRWQPESDFIETIRAPHPEEIKAAYHEAPAGF